MCDCVLERDGSTSLARPLEKRCNHHSDQFSVNSFAISMVNIFQQAFRNIEINERVVIFDSITGTKEKLRSFSPFRGTYYNQQEIMLETVHHV